MPQTALDNPMVIGRAGMLADLQATEDGDVVGATNEEASNNIPFGVFVTSSSLEGAKLPTSLADVQNGKGVVVLSDFFDLLTQLVDVTVNTNAQSAIKPTVSFAVARKARIMVIPEATGTEASGVHVRVVASGGNTQLGSFTPTLEVAKTIDISKFARWKGVPTLGLPSIVEIDCTNTALAAAD